MAIKSLARSTIRQAQRGNSALAGYESNYFHHLETVRLGGNAAFVEFTNLARYNDFQHLQIRFTGRATEADTSSAFGIELNSDTGSNYARHRLLANYVGGTLAVRSDASTSQTSMVQVAHITGGNAASSIFGAGVIDILEPFETTKNTTVRLLSGFVVSGDERVGLSSGFWNNTAAVTIIKLTPRSGSFAAGSRFSLYGLKARA